MGACWPNGSGSTFSTSPGPLKAATAPRTWMASRGFEISDLRFEISEDGIRHARGDGPAGEAWQRTFFKNDD